MRHGSAALAMPPSDSRITGVMQRTARRTASSAQSKQSAGELAAITGSGHSPLRPYSACCRSACSIRVGMPVDGPARCTLITTRGNSSITASPSASVFSAMPGPEVVVAASEPP